MEALLEILNPTSRHCHSTHCQGSVPPIFAGKRAFSKFFFFVTTEIIPIQRLELFVFYRKKVTWLVRCRQIFRSWQMTSTFSKRLAIWYDTLAIFLVLTESKDDWIYLSVLLYFFFLCFLCVGFTCQNNFIFAEKWQFPLSDLYVTRDTTFVFFLIDFSSIFKKIKELYI